MITISDPYPWGSEIQMTVERNGSPAGGISSELLTVADGLMVYRWDCWADSPAEGIIFCQFKNQAVHTDPYGGAAAALDAAIAWAKETAGGQP